MKAKLSISMNFILVLTLLCLYKVINHSGFESFMINVTWVFAIIGMIAQFFVVGILYVATRQIYKIDAIKNKPTEVKSSLKGFFLTGLNLFASYSFYTHNHKNLAYLMITSVVLGVILSFSAKYIFKKYKLIVD